MMVRGASGHSNKMTIWVVSQKLLRLLSHMGQEPFLFPSTTAYKNYLLKEKEKMKTRRILAAVLMFILVFSLTACGGSGKSDDGGVLKVVIVKQLDHASLDEIAAAIEARFVELADKEGKDYDIQTVSGQNDPTILKQLADQATADGADVIIPIATLAAQVCVSAAESYDIPVVFAAISDPEGAGLTGLKNVTGTSDALNTATIIDMMFAVDPGLKKVGLLYSLSETNSELPIREAKEILGQKGIEVVEATANTPDEVITGAAFLAQSGVGAVFTPTDNVIMSAELAIYETLRDAGIAHYAGADSFVRNGAFATCGVNYTELGYKTAELAFDAVSGKAGDLKDFYLMDGGIVTVNTETAAVLKADYSSLKSFGTVVEVVTTED